MNDYSSRSRFYKNEFNTTEDFELIKLLIQKTTGPIAELPCGSGRLLPLHKEHERITFLVDSESLMIEEINRNILAPHISPIIGDMRFWRPNTLLGLILVPRGGIQLLSNIDDFHSCIHNLSNNLSSEGILYLDIALPWNFSLLTNEILPEFMRFSSFEPIKGKSVIPINDIMLTRQFHSEISQQDIIVNLSFSLSNKTDETFLFSENYRWIHISHSQVLKVLHYFKMSVLDCFGSYDLSNYDDTSSRLIIVCKKEN